jgi:hypothetical protein
LKNSARLTPNSLNVRRTQALRFCGEDAGHDGVAGHQRQLVGEFRAAREAREDARDGEHFHGAIRFHKALGREDFREDAVFGRRVDAAADADDEVNCTMHPWVVVALKERDQAEGKRAELDEQPALEPRALGIAVVEEAGDRREEEERDEKHRAVERVGAVHLLLGDGAGGACDGERREHHGEEGVVAKGAEELADQQQRIIARRVHRGDRTRVRKRGIIGNCGDGRVVHGSRNTSGAGPGVNSISRVDHRENQ